jgi:formylglycine-generating enzyme required for sulfatase activity
VLQGGFAWDPAAARQRGRLLTDELRHAAGPTPRNWRSSRRRRGCAKKAAPRQLAEQAQAGGRGSRRRAAAAPKSSAQQEQARRTSAPKPARAPRARKLLRQQLLERRARTPKRPPGEGRAAAQAAAGQGGRGLLAPSSSARAPSRRPAPAELEVLMPTPASPVADTEGVLRDRFLDGEREGPELVLLPTGRFQMGSPEHERKIAMAAGSQKTGWRARRRSTGSASSSRSPWAAIRSRSANGAPSCAPPAGSRAASQLGRARLRADRRAPGGRRVLATPSATCLAERTHRPALPPAERSRVGIRLPRRHQNRVQLRRRDRHRQANYDGNFTYNGGARGEYRRGTTPVGSSRRTPGACTTCTAMCGNGCRTWCTTTTKARRSTAAPGKRAATSARRILRGGSWLYNPRYLRSALRNGFSAVMSNDIVGFRVVRELRLAAVGRAAAIA